MCLFERSYRTLITGAFCGHYCLPKVLWGKLFGNGKVKSACVLCFKEECGIRVERW